MEDHSAYKILASLCFHPSLMYATGKMCDKTKFTVCTLSVNLMIFFPCLCKL